MSELPSDSQKLNIDQAKEFVKQFQPDLSDKKKLLKDTEEWFENFLPISVDWLINGLKGLSPNSKSIVRQYGRDYQKYQTIRKASTKVRMKI